jgi:hypothetical protein
MGRSIHPSRDVISLVAGDGWCSEAVRAACKTLRLVADRERNPTGFITLHAIRCDLEIIGVLDKKACLASACGRANADGDQRRQRSAARDWSDHPRWLICTHQTQRQIRRSRTTVSWLEESSIATSLICHIWKLGMDSETNHQREWFDVLVYIDSSSWQEGGS